MESKGRREFMRGAIVSAGWGVVAAGAAATLGAPGPLADEGSARAEGAPPSRRYLEAVVAGDVDGVRSWLVRDPGLLHARDEAGRTGFALALLHRHPEVGALIRERGYLPDAHESALALDWQRFDSLAAPAPGIVNQDHAIGGTATFAAALGGAGDQIWRVSRYGGDSNLNHRGAAGRTAVRAAFDHPDLATAELTAASLVGNGADPNAPQAGGDSALHAAAARGSAALVEMLIRKGALVDARDAEGRTPLERAESAGMRDAADVLRRQAEIPRDHDTSRGRYDVEGRVYRAPDLSLLDVVERGRVVGLAHTDFDGLRQAVERHPLLAHSVATTTEAAIEAGAHMGRRDIVDFLLEQGAACSLPTAVMRGDTGRVTALLDEDPLRIHERGPHDFALLWYPVIGGGRIDMAELLLARGAEVERQHWLGTTALHFAASRGQIEMAALLIERGADVNRAGRRFKGAKTPLQVAEAEGHAAVVELLRRHGATA